MSARPSSRAELGPQQLVDRADDVGDHRPRGVEDAALHPLLRVIFLQEQLVEVDDRVFLRVLSSKSSTTASMFASSAARRLIDAELVEVDSSPPALPAARRLRKVSISSFRNGLVRMWAAKSAACPLGIATGSRDARGEQTVSDGLRVHVGEVVGVEVVDQRFLEGFVKCAAAVPCRSLPPAVHSHGDGSRVQGEQAPSRALWTWR